MPGSMCDSNIFEVSEFRKQISYGTRPGDEVTSLNLDVIQVLLYLLGIVPPGCQKYEVN